MASNDAAPSLLAKSPPRPAALPPPVPRSQGELASTDVNSISTEAPDRAFKLQAIQRMKDSGLGLQRLRYTGEALFARQVVEAVLIVVCSALEVCAGVRVADCRS